MTGITGELLKPESGDLIPELLASVKISSGRITACDPLTGTGKPFDGYADPGEYAVVIWRRNGVDRIAGAELKLADARPVRWEMALQEGQDSKRLDPDFKSGYPVDAGYGCFADAEAITLFMERDRQLQESLGESYISLYDNLADEELEKNNGIWADIKPFDDQELNIVMFESGWGDGYYSSYWGLDEKGKRVSLLTDFGIITE